jgi:two-component system, chemotaxis family, response regulator Rcp1
MREILVVDDNAADVDLVRESLKQTAYQSQVHAVSTASDAISYVKREGKYQNAARPDLVMLDLNLVQRDGSSVLIVLKSRSDLRQIPVVVFSSSGAAADLDRCYVLGANCYIRKPAELKRFLAAVRAIEEYWFSYVSLPQKEDW